MRIKRRKRRGRAATRAEESVVSSFPPVRKHGAILGKDERHRETVGVTLTTRKVNGKRLGVSLSFSIPRETNRWPLGAEWPSSVIVAFN